MATLGGSDENPIDLTGSDNEEEYLEPDAKRPRTNGSAATFIPHFQDFGSHMLAPPYSNGMVNSSLPSLSQPLAQRGPWTALPTPQSFQPRAWGSQPTKAQIQHQFNVLSRAQPSPFATSRPLHVTQVPPQAQQSNQQSNFIDLTGENASLKLSPAPQQSGLFTQMLVLDENLNPKTPILIGQINVSALVMSPVPYIIQRPTHTILTNGQVLTSNIIDYVPVKVRVKPEINLSSDISIFTPPQQIRGNTITPVEFAVVEKKVSAKLYQLMVERVIRLEGMIRTVPDGSNVLVVPLSVLVFTVKGNVSAIADKLRQHGLTLERPGTMWEQAFKMSDPIIYHNPHEGLPSLSKMSPSPSVSSRWSTPVAAKNVEVQRNAAEAAFQTLRGEEDLIETYPGENISTPLYPHQRKALSFLLEREQELVGPAGKAASLWHCNGSGWQNSVTNDLVYTKPEECKGSLLADDMGLGKTLETLCLIAATIDKAETFASKPLVPPSPPEPVESEPELTFDHFAGRVFDMPIVTKKATQAKDKKKAAYEKALLEYNRLNRVKEKSRATLIVCPLSTIVSWEDQIKDHWGGEVQVVGGVGSTQVAPSATSVSSSAQIGDGSLHLESLNLEPPKSDQQSRQPTPVSHNPNKKGRPIRVYVYHGASRRLDAQFVAKFDIVITTYSTLSSEYSKQSKIGNSDTTEDEEGVSSDSGVVEVDDAGNPLIKKKVKSTKRKRPFVGGDTCSPLQAIHWFRVVLDEAHCIKEPTTVASRACCDLIADRRLCLTGTPLQNKVDDVYALIKFLRLKPFDDKGNWTHWIGSPVKFNQPIGATRLQTIMRLLALRRTKDTKGPDGKPILSLPPRNDHMILLKLQGDERSVYDDFFGESQAEFKSMAKADVMKNYVNILQKILRLRQICDDVELIKASKDGMRYDCAAQYEEAIVAIDKDGINLERASAIFALLRETATAQCAECGMELASNPVEGAMEPAMDTEEVATSTSKQQRGRKMKNLGICTPSTGTGTRSSSPCPTVHPIVTRCTHLFCMCCFRSKVCPDWPRASQEFRAPCTVCQLEICPAVDAIEVQSDGADLKKKEAMAAGNVKKIRRARGEPITNYKPSTKIRALIQELLPFSKKNPHSANHEITIDDIQELDEAGREKEPDIVKSVVFSQWTSMLDRIEDALEVNKIHYERLDGGMKREERNRSMDALKNDPRCEVLLVSLKAGGVGLTLTAASRVYLMDPYWNPAVENQAVDRVHRLGQVKPVVATKFIIENSIEQRLLEVQKKKADLASMTLGRPLSKQELQQRRLEELQNLLGGGEGSANMDDI